MKTNVIEMLERRQLLSAVMQVNYVTGLGTGTTVEVPIADGTTTRSTVDGTDFGTSLSVQTTHYFVVRNSGDETLDMFSNPRIVVTGDSGDFHVTRQPIEYVSTTGFTYFAVEFLPTSSGLRQATISINSNDLSTTPYTFNVYGGTGNVLAVPDVYEPDGDGSIANQVWFNPNVTPNLARQISTDGVWAVHSIHKNNDIDWSRFTVTQDNSDVLIQTTVAKGDTRMYLYDAAGNQLGYDNDSGEGFASLIHRRLPVGDYFIRVDEFGNNAVIPIYGLSVIASPTTINLSDLPVYLNRGHTASGARDFALIIKGTENADNITLDLFNGSIRVTMDHSQVYFPAYDVDRIYIQAMEGNDTVYLAGGLPKATIYGDSGDDVFTIETASPVTVFGGDGNDIIFSGAGNDFLHGGKGDDLITGGAGNDVIQGAQGNDVLYGNHGNDTIQGQRGSDSIFAGLGNDLAIGDDAGADGWGDDFIRGGQGNDTIFGGNGDDTLVGAAGTDLIISGPDGSTIDALDGEKDFITSGSVLDAITKDDMLDVVTNAY